MTFFLHQGGVVMSSQITHNHQHTPLSHILDLRLDFHKFRPFNSLSQPHHVTSSHPSPGDNQQSTGGRSERTLGQSKMADWNSFSFICTRAHHSCRYFAHWRAISTVIPLLQKAIFTPSIQPNLGLLKIKKIYKIRDNGYTQLILSKILLTSWFSSCWQL